MRQTVNIDHMIGKTFVSVEADRDGATITFTEASGDYYIMQHHQDCCETVIIEDICGDLEDLIGTPILKAEDVSSGHAAFQLIYPSNAEEEYGDDSTTWTYYKIDTAKGGVTLRWFGSSNGYYSEEVDIDFHSSKTVH